jgi:mannosyl-oligosaccharide glucosidase
LDEGFHLLLVVEWDLDLALEVVRSWLSLMDNDGWIAREQILGLESRVKVPKDFVVQYPDISNPPMMFWIVEKYIDMLSGKLEYKGHESAYLTGKDESEKLLEELYPLLKRHYNWFRKSQQGDLLAHATLLDVYPMEAYRWRGRKPGSNYASGLHDFPRAEPPHMTELHVDALCWVGVMARTLAVVAKHSKNSEDLASLQGQYKGIKQNIDAVHWSEAEDAYHDARVEEGQHVFVNHKGYISLFPLITGFLGPEHTHLNATLNLLRDPEELWSDYGIRSLSKKDKLYGSGDSYWRSPVWMNINYLIIKELLALAQMPGPYQRRCKEIYNELRDNVIRTTYSSWKDTGFAWEQYNDKTGAGQRTQGFTGWTALVVKIMAMPDLVVEGEFNEGVKDKVEDLLKEMGKDGPLSTGTFLVGILLCGFVYFFRRRFAALFREMRR